MIENYRDQDKKLAKDILERTYFSQFRQGKKDLEVFLFGHCSANCEYCYLRKNSQILYPTNISNVDDILNNLKILLNWYIENKFKNRISIFSAEWLDNDNIRDKVFKIFYDAFKKEEVYKPIYILIPTNANFINNQQQIDNIKDWVNKFKNISIDVYLSLSVDGKYCDEQRTLQSADFYNKLADFMKEMNFLAHPMVSSTNVKNWKQNYQWWDDLNLANNLMTLEVRDETWDKNSIKDLLEFLNFEIDNKFVKDFNSNKKLFLKYILNLADNRYVLPTYNNISILHIKNSKNLISCSVNSNTLHVRLGDLSVGMCHRLYYPELEIGNFIVQNNKIIDFNEKNVSLLITKDYLNRQFLPHCDNCKFRNSCIGFCLGNSYENYMNPFVPTMEVCEMYIAKITFLFMKYLQMGLFDELENIKDELNDETIKYLTDSIREISGGIKEND